MKLKKLLMIGVMGICLGSSVPALAMTHCPLYICGFQDVVSFAAGLLAREWNRHTEKINYDVSNGIDKVKENIGAYQSEGKCGVSATGTTGCDLTTAEEGAAATEAAQAEAAVIPETTIEILKKSETDGSLTYDGDKDDDTVSHKTGDTFDQVRANVTRYIFESDEDDVNADCKCSAGTGQDCDVSQCAQQRQNDALYVASLGASSTADTYLKDIDKSYDNLASIVKSIDGTVIIAEFVGKMGDLSVYGASVVVELMNLQAHDLRAQSYRNLMSGGITAVDLSTLTEGGSQ